MKNESPHRNEMFYHCQEIKAQSLKKAIIKIAHPKIIKSSHDKGKWKKSVDWLEEDKETPHWEYVLYAIGKQRQFVHFRYCSFQYNSLLYGMLIKIWKLEQLYLLLVTWPWEYIKGINYLNHKVVLCIE